MKKSRPYHILCAATFLLCNIFSSCSKQADDGQSGDKNVIVTTFAGSGQKGSTDGPAGSASFYSPIGMAFDAAGNMYVVDSGNNKIRKITADGTVSTFAGSGQSGSVNGTGTSASFNAPECVAIDATNNLYVTDGNQIRKITPSGVVTTFAGNNNAGLTNGSIASSYFNTPGNIVMGPGGDIYVADYGNNVIRKITVAGVVSTFAGNGGQGATDGPALSASFNGIGGMAFDASGNMYVSDIYNCNIRKISTTGIVSTIAGRGLRGIQNGTGNSAWFYDPDGMVIDAAGYIYVADSVNNLVRKISPDGVTTSYAGTGSTGVLNGSGNVATFSSPRQLAKDAAGNIYLTDLANQIRKMTR